VYNYSDEPVASDRWYLRLTQYLPTDYLKAPCYLFIYTPSQYVNMHVGNNEKSEILKIRYCQYNNMVYSKIIRQSTL